MIFDSFYQNLFLCVKKHLNLYGFCIVKVLNLSIYGIILVFPYRFNSIYLYYSTSIEILFLCETLYYAKIFIHFNHN